MSWLILMAAVGAAMMIGGTITLVNHVGEMFAPTPVERISMLCVYVVIAGAVLILGMLLVLPFHPSL